MKNTRLTFFRKRYLFGFSLAEVTIATGITAIAMTTLLGLIPQGLQNIKESGDLAAQSRISRHLFGVLAQESWQDSSGSDTLSYNFDRQRYYFNDQAMLIEDERPDELEVAYVAELLVSDDDFVLPTATASDPFLRRVTVRVANVPQLDFDFENAPRLAYRSQSTVLARSGQ
jgi:uncharacterized protein (TIGR02598 family)